MLIRMLQNGCPKNNVDCNEVGSESASEKCVVKMPSHPSGAVLLLSRMEIETFG